MPRGRPPSRQAERRERNSRMGAALDAMRQYGFPERIVRQTVRELLEVYTGEWHFIEVDAYMALIEALLEKQDQRETKEIEASTSSRHDGDTSTMLIAGPSSSGVVLPEHEAEAAMNYIEAPGSSSRVDEAIPLASALPTLELDCPPGFEGYRRCCKDARRDHDSGGGRQASALMSNRESSDAEGILQSVARPPGFEGYRRCCKDAGRDHDSGGGRQASALMSNGESSDAEGILQSVVRLSPTFGFAPQVVANGVHLRSRRCYNGFICGEEEAEMMQLRLPPLLPEFLTKFVKHDGKQRPRGQRKRRWDVRSEDL
ncbi:uncharacterized protein LOC104454385 [Eucalyptus grandis]|uniref:uncharacterized protein LOC104454385 n=1 Tax=Eucalyptus grandis TaxID=71139 RepID=UPI0005262328|nr:uncharacterized protein LOC104454385 [Eucalyptus grandis]